MRRFEDKVVIITGAGSGIGQATAKRFSEEGATVVLAGRTRDKLEETAADLPAKSLICPTDVAIEADVDTLIDTTLENFGKIDVLVNNAGTATMGSLLEQTLEDWEKVMTVNTTGVFLCSHRALPHLIKSQGCIINTSSVSGLGGDWGLAIYNASKGAVTNFTRALAMEFGKHNVRVNAVCPSLTRTDMASGITENDEKVARFKERLALPRIGEPKDVAAAIAFLASEDASFISGVNLPVDGGLTASNGQPAIGG